MLVSSDSRVLRLDYLPIGGDGTSDDALLDGLDYVLVESIDLGKSRCRKLIILESVLDSEKSEATRVSIVPGISLILLT